VQVHGDTSFLSLCKVYSIELITNAEHVNYPIYAFVAVLNLDESHACAVVAV